MPNYFKYQTRRNFLLTVVFNGNFPRLVIVSTGNGYDRDKKFDFSGTGTFHDKIFMACISLNNETIPHSTFGE